MKKISFSVSLYIIVPFVLAGLVVLAVIVSYQIADYIGNLGGDTSWPLLYWGAIAGLIALIIGLLLVRLFLKPMQRFVETASQLPAISTRGPETHDTVEGDELKRYTRVFDQVTEVLSNVDARNLFPEMVAESRVMRGILNRVVKVAPTDSAVLILGESGTGKELIASAVHRHSQRRQKSLVAINCAAIPAELLESELFGHEKGAFTGAVGKKPGKFELADGGTIFLDEIGDMPLPLQAKILRVLEEKQFYRVGGTKPVKVDFRFVAATNQDLGRMVEERRFREDLYYRLRVVTIRLPALRQRREDIAPLIYHITGARSEPVTLADSAMEILERYTWPGNIRELQNVLEEASCMAEGGKITADNLPVEVTEVAIPGISESVTREDKSLDDILRDVEKMMIFRAMMQSGGVQAQAAKLLGIKERSLWHRIKKHEIDPMEIKRMSTKRDSSPIGA